MDTKIAGVFEHEHDASQAIEELKRRGFYTDDISVIARNTRQADAIADDTGTRVPEGLASGAATGGFLGGLTGLLAGIGALAIPGIGPILAAGPIAATLAGAAVGAGTGGLVGGLIGLGIPEDEARSYNKEIDAGRILLMVDAEAERASEVQEVFHSHHSLNAGTLPEPPEPRSMALPEREPITAEDMADAAAHGHGREGRKDTGLDTMNAGRAQ